MFHSFTVTGKVARGLGKAGRRVVKAVDVYVRYYLAAFAFLSAASGMFFGRSLRGLFLAARWLLDLPRVAVAEGLLAWEREIKGVPAPAPEPTPLEERRALFREHLLTDDGSGMLAVEIITDNDGTEGKPFRELRLPERMMDAYGLKPGDRVTEGTVQLIHAEFGGEYSHVTVNGTLERGDDGSVIETVHEVLDEKSEPSYMLHVTRPSRAVH